LDSLSGQLYLLCLSPEPPQFTAFAAQFGFADQPGEFYDYTPFLRRLQVGQQWQFRLCANPVLAVKQSEAGQRGKLRAHVTPQQQEQWLLMKAEKCGFSLAAGQFRVIGDSWRRFSKGGSNKTITLHTVSFDGLLTITDLPLFLAALTEGIGRGKAYGCGLLTLARMRP
jgi:CRISPR system Cascade subunit CasE